MAAGDAHMSTIALPFADRHGCRSEVGLLSVCVRMCVCVRVPVSLCVRFGYLQEEGELAVTEGHVLLLLCDRGEHAAEARERLVDVARLFEPFAGGIGLGETLRTCEVHQVQ